MSFSRLSAAGLVTLLLCLLVPAVRAENLHEANNASVAAELNARLHSWKVSCEASPRPQDQVWMISTRGLGEAYCASPEHPALRVQRFEPQTGWQASTIDEFVAGELPDLKTVFYIHGNRIDYPTSLHRGWIVYNAITCVGTDDRPLRFVIWSWPSDQVRGQLRDFRVKAERTNSEGYYLGWTLAHICRHQQVSLIGYSFGARIVTGGLHVLGGGMLAGHVLPRSLQHEHPRVRAALIVAALPNYWLQPGQRHGQAIQQVDRMLLYHNYCDPALKHYHIVERGSRDEALGYTGISGLHLLGDDARRIRHHEVHAVIGKSHDVQRYYHSTQLMNQIRSYVLWQNVD